MENFKVGDRVRFKHDSSNDSHIPPNEDGKYCTIYKNNIIGTVQRIISAGDSKNELLQVDFDDGTKAYENSSSGFFSRRYELVFGKEAKVKKQIKHVVFQDSCSNYIGMYGSETDAINAAKVCNKEDMTVFKLIQVAKVTTERKVIIGK